MTPLSQEELQISAEINECPGWKINTSHRPNNAAEFWLRVRKLVLNSSRTLWQETDHRRVELLLLLLNPGDHSWPGVVTRFEKASLLTRVSQTMVLSDFLHDFTWSSRLCEEESALGAFAFERGTRKHTFPLESISMPRITRPDSWAVNNITNIRACLDSADSVWVLLLGLFHTRDSSDCRFWMKMICYEESEISSKLSETCICNWLKSWLRLDSSKTWDILESRELHLSRS